MTDRDTANTRYRASLCIACGINPYSAGRTRCTTCHRDWITAGCPGDTND